MATLVKTTFGNATAFDLVFGTQFSMGSKKYTYIGYVKSAELQMCTFLDGSKKELPTKFKIHTLMTENGKYVAYRESELKNKTIVIF